MAIAASYGRKIGNHRQRFRFTLTPGTEVTPLRTFTLQPPAGGSVSG